MLNNVFQVSHFMQRYFIPEVTAEVTASIITALKKKPKKKKPERTVMTGVTERKDEGEKKPTW